MHAFDILALLVILFTSIRGLLRGFVTEVFSMGAVILGLLIAVVFSGRLMVIIATVYTGPMVLAVSFLVLFLLSYMLVHLMQGLIYRGVVRLHLESLDRALGFFAGICKGALVTITVLTVIALQPFAVFKTFIKGSAALELSTPVLNTFTQMVQKWLHNV